MMKTCRCCAKYLNEADLQVTCNKCDANYHCACVGLENEQLYICKRCAMQDSEETPARILQRRTEVINEETRSNRTIRTKSSSKKSNIEKEQAIVLDNILSAVEDKIELNKMKMDLLQRRGSSLSSKSSRCSTVGSMKQSVSAWVKAQSRFQSYHSCVSDDKYEIPGITKEIVHNLHNDRDININEVHHIKQIEQETCYPSFQPQLQTQTKHVKPEYSENQVKKTMERQNFKGNSDNNRLESVLTTFMAKQFMKDLPYFDGTAKDWIMFRNSFNKSTKLCAYDNDDNLYRLQRSLKGKARNLVERLLSDSHHVPQIMSLLEFNYGRPELIISEMLEYLKKAPMVRDDVPDSIINFYTTIETICFNLKECGEEGADYLISPQLLNDLVKKLSRRLATAWVKKSSTRETNNIENFCAFLKTNADQSLTLKIRLGIGNATLAQNQSKPHEKNHMNVQQEMKSSIQNIEGDSSASNEALSLKQFGLYCALCKSESHVLPDCDKFKNISCTKRQRFVEKRRLCYICLKGKHHADKCSQNKICDVEGCTRRHHILLCKNSKYNREEKSISKNQSEIEEAKESQSANTSATQSKKMSATMNSVDNSCEDVHYRIVPVKLYGPNGKELETYAFLDEGSVMTVISENTANILGVTGTPEEICLGWTDGSVRTESNSQRINIDISGLGQFNKRYTLRDVRTVNQLNLPAPTYNLKDLQARYSYLNGIDITEIERKPPAILIGGQHHKLGLTYQVREGENWNSPSATLTRLGWSIWGPSGSSCQTEASSTVAHICICKNDHDAELHKAFQEFNTTESFGVKAISKAVESRDDARGRMLLEKYTRKVDDMYESCLLWKDDNSKLPYNRDACFKRLLHLEKKMQKDPVLQAAMIDKIKSNVLKGYARKLSQIEAEERTDRTFYLPIFAIINDNKPGKIRVVYDAAAKVEGFSLNDYLLKGPDFLVPLISVLFKFRERPVAVCGDIAEMFHRIKIRHDDQHSQRFLWRDGDVNKKPDDYAMVAMTFGATCSPSTAQFVKNKNALQFMNQFPRAVLSITNRHYVDDLLDSFDDEEEAIRTIKDIIYIHQEGGFEIRNFSSNKVEVLRAIQESDNNNCKDLSLKNPQDTEKVLGMYWRTDKDTFTFKVNMKRIHTDIVNKTRSPTKREVLRIVMAIFDPLGFLANYVVFAKILLHDIWAAKIEWDQQLPPVLYVKWLRWFDEINRIEEVSIPRCYNDIILQTRSIQLHTFVDASESAFAAVCYIRMEVEGEVRTSLIASKTRVAPKKRLTVPKLELQAALLGARLSNTIEQEHSFAITEKFYWSDSKTVLGWLKCNHQCLKTFVFHRVSEIEDITDLKQWNWIASKENVADEATKWDQTPSFSSNNRWFSGPPFLKESREYWLMNQDDGTGVPESCFEEMKPTIISAVHIRKHDVYESYKSERFSNFFRMRYSIAWVYVYIKKLQNRIKSSTVTKEELKNNCASFCKMSLEEKRLAISKIDRPSSFEVGKAENQMWRIVQHASYFKEMLALKSNKPVDRNSDIRGFSPYLDEFGVIRMDGRIDATPALPISVKRPIILERRHRITTLLIDSYHRIYNHQAHETVVNEIRQRFWIPKLRVALRSVKSSCMHCKFKRAKPNIPEMSKLPAERITPYTPPFTNTGIDFFGPIEVKNGRKIEKRWGVIFTCATTRAIHLEMAYSLTTSSCIIAIRKFVSRRGQPSVMFSDNGTNLHGSERELREEIEKINMKQLENYAIIPKPGVLPTIWKFNPPASPHFGGLFEKMVDSVKRVLYTVLKQRTPSDEILTCLLCEAENTVNSRPLTYLPLNDENEECLTPNHFLRGRENNVFEPGQFCEADLFSQKQWRIVQSLENSFWKRWIKEYLPTLTKRTKWFDKVKNIEVGDLVIICDDTAPRNVWQRGKIIEVYPSKDGTIRSALVQTSTGKYQRPVHKLSVLDVKLPAAIEEEDP